MKLALRTALVGCVALSMSTCALATALSASAANSAPTAGRTPASTVALPRVTAACSPTLLFEAAVRKEHFSTTDLPPGPRATIGKCYAGWAVAAISRPNVGMTDGDTLFRSHGTTWAEVEQLTNGPVECWLEALGISPTVSSVLSDGYKGSAEAGCTTPLHGLATEKSDIDFSHLIEHLPYSTINVTIGPAANADKQVIFEVTILLSQVDLSDRSQAIARYKSQAAAYMESYGVNPADYIVRYTISGA